MAGDTQITIIGNLTADPELRFTPQGIAVANFTIASTPREYDRASGSWKEGETLFLRASIWREAAENAANTLKKGMRVIAQGYLKSRTYETKEGERRTSFELEAHEIGPSLRFASAQVRPNPRGYQTQPPAQGFGSQPQTQPPAQPQGQPAGGDNGYWAEQASNQPAGDWGTAQPGQDVADEPAPF